MNGADCPGISLYVEFASPDAARAFTEKVKTSHGSKVTISDAEINIKPTRVNLCYVESIMSKYDAIYDGPVNANRMRFSEILVFICKVAYEVYVGTPDGIGFIISAVCPWRPCDD